MSTTRINFINEVRVVISVIIPVHNGDKYLDECISSIRQQINPSENNLEIEVSSYDDSSTDRSLELLEKWSRVFEETPLLNGFFFSFKYGRNNSGRSKGAGQARNRAIENSTGEFLCFIDADDVMMPERIHKQYDECIKYENGLIGSRFIREPPNSSAIFTQWANSLNNEQINAQIYLTFGPTLIMTTWFLRRSSFYKSNPNGFIELRDGDPAQPEDLILYYQHLDAGGTLHCIDEVLMMYRYHSDSITFSISQEIIRDLRLKRLEEKVLKNWTAVTIWNAGKLGKRTYRSLSEESKKKVVAFCDVDLKKIGNFFNPHPSKAQIPIEHFTKSIPPFLICVQTEMTLDEDGEFMKNLKSLCLNEGNDYVFFN